ncbi:Transferase [Aspergillus sclerotialis]|uniref:Transferase n=1 Tax=Aspergillus sclerotialis TaxID=2070753 RepID=A0A3A2ZWF0_9EURO|nr:Transferase [Aspergillus sclerotialis]
MPLPFPFPFHIGTDIVHLPRILRLITRPGYLTRFTSRILTDQEQSDFRRRFHLPASSDSTVKFPVSRDMASWLAGRFAAKEAARKAAPEGAAELGWKDVCVTVGEGEKGKSAKPEILYKVPGRLGRLSISHDADYVVATVLAVGEVD